MLITLIIVNNIVNNIELMLGIWMYVSSHVYTCKYKEGNTIIYKCILHYYKITNISP